MFRSTLNLFGYDRLHTISPYGQRSLSRHRKKRDDCFGKIVEKLQKWQIFTLDIDYEPHPIALLVYNHSAQHGDEIMDNFYR